MIELQYHTTETVAGKVRRLRMAERLALYNADVDALIIPDILMNPAEFILYVHQLQQLGNIGRSIRQELEDKLLVIRQDRDRLQKSIGAASFLKNAETGKPMAEIQRKSLAGLVTAVIGPVEVGRPITDDYGQVRFEWILSKGPQGIKKGIFAVDRLNAIQLFAYISPGTAEAEIPQVEQSYDDLYLEGELLLKHLDDIETELKNRHFVLGHVTKILEIENFEGRRVSREGA